ncbi:MAG: phage holin family protein [Hyphomicrobiales bacterium]|nr:phage holin family protein [Hyphomicrobiales bacterium]
MADDTFRDSGLTRLMSTLAADLNNLVQKELRLARAEMSEKLGNIMSAGIGYAIAGVFALLALMLLAQGVVLWIASQGMALHWASLSVAAATAVIALAFYLYGRSAANQSLVPRRAVRQLNADIRAAKEQLS